VHGYGCSLVNGGSTKIDKMLKRINRKVHKYHIQAISLKVPSLTHHSDGIKRLITEITNYCSLHNIQLYTCTIKDIKAHNTIDIRKSKRLLVQSLGEKYPLLYHRAHQELISRNRHYTRMFEAVAAAELIIGTT